MGFQVKLHRPDPIGHYHKYTKLRNTTVYKNFIRFSYKQMPKKSNRSLFDISAYGNTRKTE